MQKFSAIASIAIAAAGGRSKLTWKDCGDVHTHGKAGDIRPTSLRIGDPITGAWSTDKQVNSGSFAIKLTAGVELETTFTGKICEAAQFELPIIGGGTLDWAGLDCPLEAGSYWSIGLNMTSTLPEIVGQTTLAFIATDQDDEKALCFTLHLAEETCNDKDGESGVCCHNSAGVCGLEGIKCRDAPRAPYENDCGLETDADNCCYYEDHYSSCSLCGTTTTPVAMMLVA